MHVLRRVQRSDEWNLPQLRRRTRAAAAPESADLNYRHAYHAGNFADVLKHTALVAALLHLRKKDKPFRVIDSHAGRGLYALESAEALRTGEAAQGIARLADLAEIPDLPPALATYLDGVRAEGRGNYPGSPRLAARLLRPGDGLVAIERHPVEAEALRASLAPFRNVRVLEDDGYARLPTLLPPAERRGLILIDPPYEAGDEFARAADALSNAHRRFATGIFMLWYPIKSAPAADAFCGEVFARGIQKALRLEISVGAEAGAEKERLAASGLLVVNAPYGFEEEMRAVALLLAPRLGRTPQAPAKISLLPL
jgi:23S rRNA (adenine2030-N6)-methyltransferase